MQTLFGHILNAEEDLMRERAARFLVAKLRQLSPDVITREVEDYIVEQSKVVLQDCTGDEFVLFMNLLAQLSHLQTVAGRQHLLSIVNDQADLEKGFDVRKNMIYNWI